MKYTGRYVGTIGVSEFSEIDLAKIRGAIGHITQLDKGKQVFDIAGVYQVENNEQRDGRIYKLRAAGFGDRTNGPAPDDKQAEYLWGIVMGIASKAGLIVSAYGGVATLAIPSEQRKSGVRDSVLAAGLFEPEGVKL